MLENIIFGFAEKEYLSVGERERTLKSENEMEIEI
jgi:hypothetical protein